MKDFKVPLNEDEIPQMPGFEKEYSDKPIKRVRIQIFNLEDQTQADELALLLTKSCTNDGVRLIHHENKILENGMCKSFNIWAEV
jgi:hypothetical protein